MVETPSPLTPEQFAVADAARKWVASTIQERPGYLSRRKLSPAVWNPAGNWSPDAPFLCKVRLLLENGPGPRRGWTALDELRTLAQQFSGHHLADERHDADPVVTARFRELLPSLPSCHLSPPLIMDERGWMAEGRLINFDVVAYLERLAILHAVALVDAPRVLEIGAGYGGLAWFMRQASPHGEYAIVDLPESLIYSAPYLAVACPATRQWYGERGPGFSFWPNYRFPELVESGARFDLVINTLSMSEMTGEQVDAYCEGIRILIGDAGVFFDQNQDNRHLGFLNARDHITRHFPHSVALGDCGEPVFLQQGAANLWANHPLNPELPARVRRALEMPRLVGSRGNVNLVAFRGDVFEIPQAAGALSVEDYLSGRFMRAARLGAADI